jgi:dTDP-4-dehydrorhamnose 3,5-epimerase
MYGKEGRESEVHMDIQNTAIADVKLIKPKKMGDARGFFSETYNQRALATLSVSGSFVQDNHSLSVQKGTVRGLHFQLPPFAQDKLVRVIRGAVFDVALDLRRGSPTFKRHVAVVLSQAEWNQIFVPIGFAHGFCTLEPETEVIYKVNNYYSPEHERGILWNDPELAIPWPVSEREAFVSDKDRKNPLFLQMEELDF